MFPCNDPKLETATGIRLLDLLASEWVGGRWVTPKLVEKNPLLRHHATIHPTAHFEEWYP